MPRRPRKKFVGKIENHLHERRDVEVAALEREIRAEQHRRREDDGNDVPAPADEE